MAFGAASVDDYGRVIPTIDVYARPQARPQVQAPLNQINPSTTYVSPNTPQPSGAAPAVGQTDTQSGQPVHATYDQPQPLAKQAANYRRAHGLVSNDDSAATDALNAESLAAAQAGRNYLNPTLASQYAQPQAAGTYGPQTNVVNALTTPATTQAQPTAVAQAQPSAATAPTSSAAWSQMTPAQRALLWQRIQQMQSSNSGQQINPLQLAAALRQWGVGSG